MKDILQNQIMVFGLTKQQWKIPNSESFQKRNPKQLTLDHDPSNKGHI